MTLTQDIEQRFATFKWTVKPRYKTDPITMEATLVGHEVQGEYIDGGHQFAFRGSAGLDDGEIDEMKESIAFALLHRYELRTRGRL